MESFQSSPYRVLAQRFSCFYINYDGKNNKEVDFSELCIDFSIFIKELHAGTAKFVNTSSTELLTLSKPDKCLKPNKISNLKLFLSDFHLTLCLTETLQITGVKLKIRLPLPTEESSITKAFQENVIFKFILDFLMKGNFISVMICTKLYTLRAQYYNSFQLLSVHLTIST